MTTLPIEQLAHMTPFEEQQFWKRFEKILSSDDGQAAQSHLLAGRPIYYCDDRYPDNYIREWPDGQSELVSVDEAGAISVIRSL